MNVFGIDFGNANCVVAVARRGGVDIVLNESSNRQTPAYVGFSQQGGHRLLGEPALDALMGNSENTICNIKRLIGRKFNDPLVQAELKYCPFKVVPTQANGDVAVVVKHGEETVEYTITQILAMYLAKLKRIVEKEVSATVVDCVISVPAFFTDVERRAVMDAAQIAELKVLRLMNENTAAALVYGLPKADLPEEAPFNVILLDVGHAHLQVSAVAFVKGKLTVLASEHDAGIGGRDFDELLARHFNAEFAEKFKVDVYNGEPSRARRKALLRLRAGCEKLKRTLSANAKGTVSVECIMDEKDVNGEITRDAFEAMATDLLERLKSTLKRLMAASGLTFDKIGSVELVGSATRIPCIIKMAQDFFNIEPKRTLDSSECIGKGCAFQAAMLSPTFRVRSFNINDISLYPISLSWQPTKEDEGNAEANANACVIFTKNNVLPSVKILTFTRSEAFELTAEYTADSGLRPEQLHIGKFQITDIPKTRDGGPAKIKVKIGLNLAGLIYVESATMHDEYEVEELVPVKVDPKPAAPAEKKEEPAAAAADADAADGTAKMDTDAPPADAEAPAKMDTDTPAEAEKAPEKPAEPQMEKVKKKKITRADLKVVAQLPSMAKRELDLALEKEVQMAVTDRVIAETAEAKNALETYVYDFRDRLGGTLAEFCAESQRTTLADLLQKTEDWLYDEGSEQPKAEYVKKLGDLKALGDPIEKRFQEHEGRPNAIDALNKTVTSFLADGSSADEKFAHIEQAEKDKVLAECKVVQQWLADKIAAQDKLAKHVDAVLLTAEIIKKATELTNFAKPILNKPKPKPPPKEEKKEEEKKPEEPKEAKEEAPQPQPMDTEVD